MTFSFIIPVYNAEPYLRDCLDSLLSQDLTDCEVIVIDDGSKDASGAICDEYADKCRVFHVKNGGVSKARNYGLDRAQGKYVAFLDSDDMVTDNFVATYREAVRTEADIYHFNSYRTHHETELMVHGVTTDLAQARRALLTFRQCQPWDKIFVRELIGNKRFDESMKLYEDFAFLLDYYRDVKKIYVSNSAVYRYFVRKSSISSKGKLQYFASCDRIYEKICAFAKEYGISDLYSARKNLLFITTLIGARLYHGGHSSREIKGALRALPYYRALVKEHYAEFRDKVRRFCLKTGWFSLAHRFFYY